jgi:Flp pilus assembly protein TadD
MNTRRLFLIVKAIQLESTNLSALITRGTAFAQMGDLVKACNDLDEVIRLNPENGVAYANRGLLRAWREDYASAVADCTKATELEPKLATAHNNLAWILATCPDDHIRDGQRALKHAKKACDLSAWNKWSSLGTLAAAYAELGDFKQAVKYQTQAITGGKIPDKDRKAADERLQLYKKRKVYRETIH